MVKGQGVVFKHKMFKHILIFGRQYQFSILAYCIYSFFLLFESFAFFLSMCSDLAKPALFCFKNKSTVLKTMNHPFLLH